MNFHSPKGWAAQINEDIVELPTLHAGQLRAWGLINSTPLTAIRCGRRWGKTELGITVAGDDSVKGRLVGWFAPDYKKLSEVYNRLRKMLFTVLESSNKTAGEMVTHEGGKIEFWTLDNESAGRSRAYHTVVIDEGAFTKKTMRAIWEQSIKPTLLDYNGRAIVLSNTAGEDPENFFWQICNIPEMGFKQFHAPTHQNPTIPKRDPRETFDQWMAKRVKTLQKLRTDNPPLVYQQEYLAQFVNWDGVAFFEKSKLLIGEGKHLAGLVGIQACDSVFSIIDSATKTGKENDGTAVVFFAVNVRAGGQVYPLIILDWDLQQIEGALLERWLPSVFTRLEDFAKRYKARMGSIGTWIEDKSSGMVLLQQAASRNWPAQAIDSKLTSLGKSERAIDVSGHVYTHK